MKLALALVSLMACGTDIGAGAGGGGGGGNDAAGGGGGDSGGGGMVTNVSGHITANTTWTDYINVVGTVTVDKNVTVMVAPGTSIKVVDAATAITLNGTFDIEGTKASPVTIVPGTAGGHWAGFNVTTGGVLISHYLIGNGGGVHLNNSGMATIIDTQLSRDTHDLITMTAGTIDIEYSSLGLEPGMADTTHCDMHFSGNVSLKITHTNISTSLYGLMFYGGVAADFTHDNWFGNTTDIDPLPGVQGDFSSSWFAKGTPAPRTGFTFNTMSSARLTDAGPR